MGEDGDPPLQGERFIWDENLPREYPLPLSGSPAQIPKEASVLRPQMVVENLMTETQQMLAIAEAESQLTAQHETSQDTRNGEQLVVGEELISQELVEQSAAHALQEVLIGSPVQETGGECLLGPVTEARLEDSQETPGLALVTQALEMEARVPNRWVSSDKSSPKSSDEEDDGIVDYVALSQDYDPYADHVMSRTPKKKSPTPKVESKVESHLPKTFWEESAQLEDILRKPEVFPASPKNKKKNHARRERRLGVQRRLADEKLKAEEIAARLQRRQEQREKRRATQKAPRLPFAENPAVLKLRNQSSNH
jgi:hypothetical protein